MPLTKHGEQFYLSPDLLASYLLPVNTYWMTIMFGYDTETHTGLSAHAQFNEN